MDVPAALTANTVLVHHQTDSRHDHLLHLSETPAVWMYVSTIILYYIVGHEIVHRQMHILVVTLCGVAN